MKAFKYENTYYKINGYNRTDIKWIKKHIRYVLFFIFCLFIRWHYLFYTYTRAVSKHTVAIALTRRAIYKIYFEIYLLSFRKLGQFTQRLNCQVTVFILLIISIDPTGACKRMSMSMHSARVVLFATRIRK